MSFEIDKVDISFNQLTGHKLLNGIEIIRKLGSGQYGKVILGKDLVNKRFVAIKEVPRYSKPKLLKINKAQMEYPSKVLHEVEIMRRCSTQSPNVIQLFNVLNDLKYSNVYLILEYCYKGEVKWMSKDRSNNTCKNLAEVVRIVKGITIGLEYLKSNRIIHRDIKPSNLLIDHRGVVKISDFGVSYYVLDDEKQVQKDLNQTVGTPMFLPPELCNIRRQNNLTDSIDTGSTSVNGLLVNVNEIQTQTENTPKEPRVFLDYKLDIWSFGVSIYCLVFNCLPFSADNEFELFTKITHDKISYLKPSGFADDPDYPVFLSFLQSILMKDPQERPSIEALKISELIQASFSSLQEKLAWMNFNSSDNQRLLGDSRLDSSKTINTISSKTILGASGGLDFETEAPLLNSSSIKYLSNSSSRILSNSSSRLVSNSSQIIANTSQAMSTSSSQISNISNVSTKSNSSKKSFGNLRKTFSKLKLLGSDTSRTSSSSKRLPSAEKESPETAEEKKIPPRKQNQKPSQPPVRPSFTNLIRKKSSQLLGKLAKRFSESVEELLSPIKFKYKDEKSHMDKVTVRLVDDNEKLMTPEEYKKQDLNIAPLGNKNLLQQLQNVETLHDATSLDTPSIVSNGTDDLEDSQPLKNFFNNLSEQQESLEDFSSDFEDEDEEDDRERLKTIVPSAKKYNLNEYLLKADLLEEDDDDFDSDESYEMSGLRKGINGKLGEYLDGLDD